MPDAMPAPLGSPYVTDAGQHALQLLRAAAVSLLVLYHVALLAPGAPAGFLYGALVRLGAMGWVGTDVLLALSGFLAVGSRGRSPGALAWLGRRAMRVLPPFAVFLLVYLYLVPSLIVAAGGPAETLQTFELARRTQGYLWLMATNLLMVMGRRPGAALEPLLTLGVGVQLTLVAALLLSKTRPWITVAGLALLECSGFALRAAWLEGDAWRSYSFPLTRCDAFASGMAMAYLLSHPRWGERLRQVRRLVVAVAGVGLVAVVVVTRGLPVHSKATMLVGYPTVGVFCGALVLLLSQAERPRAWLQRLAVAGSAAYAVYLVKLPAVFMVRHALEAWGSFTGLRGLLELAALGLLTSGFIGGVFHLAVERPLARTTPRGVPVFGRTG
jgi:peptidoglycan/LPS O-acetylase OafA/YrhL